MAAIFSRSSKFKSIFSYKTKCLRYAYEKCIRQLSSVSKISSVKLLHAQKPVHQNIIIQGWIRGVRKQKEVVFLDLDDGSSSQSLQVIVPSAIVKARLSNGACISVEGELVPSNHPKQEIELKANSVNIVGSCEPEQYPLQNKKLCTMDYVRQYPHLRPRLQTFSSIFKVRNAATMALHSYFQKNGYYLINTPILTSNDCEGAGETFKVSSNSFTSKGETDDSDDPQTSNLQEEVPPEKLFNNDVYLTVSGQLHLECVACGGLPKVYTFGPVFRAENTRTRRHLNEFYMLEAEIAFTKSLDDLLEVMEDMIKTASTVVQETCPEELSMMEKKFSPDHQRKLVDMLSSKFNRISYSDAVKLLKEKTDFRQPINWGASLQREHELFVVEKCGNRPVFVTDFPSESSAFYMKRNPHDRETVAGVDLLMPEVGELCGGSLREEDTKVLQERVNKLTFPASLDWYLDLRRYGTVPHGGFGLGFERYLRLLTGVPSIKDVVPFPRWPHHCQL